MVCRQTFLCTSNKGKLDEHIEGKHAGKATFEVSQRTSDLTGLCELEHPLPRSLLVHVRNARDVLWSNRQMLVSASAAMLPWVDSTSGEEGQA